MAHGDIPHLVGDLHGQLAGGGQDDGLHRLALGVDALNDGNAEGHVLPVPVGAFAMTSFPASMGGMQPACTGVLTV